MKGIQLLMIGIILFLVGTSCEKKNGNSNSVEITGTLQKQGITTYQYGSHVMAGYALQSSTVNLDDYVNQNVTVTGYKIEGYPIDGGPDFIEVETIQ